MQWGKEGERGDHHALESGGKDKWEGKWETHSLYGTLDMSR